jgi:hypothetical protein
MLNHVEAWKMLLELRPQFISYLTSYLNVPGDTIHFELNLEYLHNAEGEHVTLIIKL